MILDLTGGIPHIAIPALVGSMAAELIGFSNSGVLLGALIGVAVFYIGRFIVTELLELFSHHKPRS